MTSLFFGTAKLNHYPEKTKIISYFYFSFEIIINPYRSDLEYLEFIHTWL
jgi:hypothetical protein